VAEFGFLARLLFIQVDWCARAGGNLPAGDGQKLVEVDGMHQKRRVTQVQSVRRVPSEAALWLCAHWNLSNGNLACQYQISHPGPLDTHHWLRCSHVCPCFSHDLER